MNILKTKSAVEQAENHLITPEPKARQIKEKSNTERVKKKHNI